MKEVLRLLARDIIVLLLYILRIIRDAWPLIKEVLIFAAGVLTALLFVSYIIKSMLSEVAIDDTDASRQNGTGILYRIEKKIAFWSLDISFRVFRNIYDWCREVLEYDEAGKYDDR